MNLKYNKIFKNETIQLVLRFFKDNKYYSKIKTNMNYIPMLNILLRKIGMEEEMIKERKYISYNDLIDLEIKMFNNSRNNYRCWSLGNKTPRNCQNEEQLIYCLDCFIGDLVYYSSDYDIVKKGDILKQDCLLYCLNKLNISTEKIKRLSNIKNG